jgi:hypothetical protein
MQNRQTDTKTLDILAAEIDRQLVLNLGREPLAGSGFEYITPVGDFDGLLRHCTTALRFHRGTRTGPREAAVAVKRQRIGAVESCCHKYDPLAAPRTMS